MSDIKRPSQLLVPTVFSTSILTIAKSPVNSNSVMSNTPIIISNFFSGPSPKFYLISIMHLMNLMKHATLFIHKDLITHEENLTK